ncbi:MAG: AMP-binding protein [Methylocystaceae bacterium]|nr:AMP-binding protein [Methylocystaceae bacterium]
MTNGFICQNNPTGLAVVTHDGTHITYQQLLKDVHKSASFLFERELLFIVGANDYPTLLFYLAALECGAVPLILSADVDAQLLTNLINIYAPNKVLIGALPDSLSTQYEKCGQHAALSLFQQVNPRSLEVHPDLGFLAATSGSTGAPKLVRLSVENLVENAKSISQYLEIAQDDRAMASLPISYSYGLSIINSHLYAGGSIILSNRSILEPEYWQSIRDHQVTSFAGVPFHYEMLLRLRLERLNVPSLRKMTQAGGKLKPTYIKKIYNSCRDLGIKFWTMYGQTEASPRISYLAPEKTLDKLSSIGQAIPNGRLWVRNQEGEDISFTNQVGELVYEGPNVCLGYAESEQDLSLGDVNDKRLNTGDLARCDEDGYFFIEGRMSRFLKIYGNRISLDQVEKVVCAKGMECAAYGEDDHLWVSIVSENAEETENLKLEIAKILGLNSKAITCVETTDLPRMASGKVDYQCLKRAMQEA